MMEEENYLAGPNRYEILEIWMGLPLREKVLMIIKQFYQGM